MSKTIVAYGGYKIVVDDDVYEWASRYHWYVSCGYAMTYVDGHHKQYMHRLIANAQKGQTTDHINSDRLDNRRQNLRVCSIAENTRNQHKKGKRHNRPTSSNYKGVSWNRLRGKWEAYITYKRRRYGLGYFDDEVAAAKAYDEAAKKYHGEFALTNF